MDISTAIGVHDAFSEPLRNMANALNMTISSFEHMQEVSNNPIDIKGLTKARDGLSDIEIALNNFDSNLKLDMNVDTTKLDMVKSNIESIKHSDLNIQSNFNELISESNRLKSVLDGVSIDNLKNVNIMEVASQVTELGNSVNNIDFSKIDRSSSEFLGLQQEITTTKSELNSLIDSSVQLNSIGNGIDTTGLQHARSELANVEIALNNFDSKSNINLNVSTNFNEILSESNRLQKTLSNINTNKLTKMDLTNTISQVTQFNSKLNSIDFASIDKSSPHFNKLQNEIVNTKMELNSLLENSDRLKHIGRDVGDLSKLRNELNKTEIGFGRVNNEINDSAESQRRFNQEIVNGNTNATSLYGMFKKIAGVAGLMRGIKLFKDGFNIYREFNLEMANLEAVTLATSREMEYLHHTAKQMGETTIFSAGQSAMAMTELAKGGLEVYEIVSSIPEVLNLSSASGMELAQSAGIVVDIMRGFNLEADKMDRIVDLIAYTSSNATTSVSLMGETFGYSAKIADTFNASIEETAALIGMMSSAAKGSKAGTALRAGFGRMASPTADAQEWLDRLQIDFIDPSTNELKSVTDNVNNLAVAFEGITDAQKIQAGKAIFGEQGYNAWLAVIQQGQGAMDEWLVAFDENAVGTAERMKEIMLNTTDGVLQLHKSEVEGIWINFYEGLADDVVGEAFKSVLGAMRTVLEVGLNLATGVFIVLGHGIEFLSSNMDLLIPILFTLVGVWAVLNAEMIISAGASLVNIGVQALQAVAYGILVGWTMLQATATFILTLATQGLSAALMATPIGWVIAGIVILIGIVFLAVAGFNRLANTSYSAMGVIVGSVYWAGAVMMNIVIGTINAIIQLMWIQFVEPFIGIVEWVLNVANGGFNSFGDAVANLIGNIISWFLSLGMVVTKIIDAIFGTDWTGGLSNLKNDVLAWGKNEDAITLSREAPTIDHRFDYGDAWDSGYNMGENIGQGMKDMFSFDTPGLGDGFDFDDMGGFGEEFDLGLNGPGGINDKLGNIDKNTKGINDKMEVSEEDIKYLRDLAANTIMGRLTSNDIKMEVINHNTISSDMDIDGVISTMTDGLEENVKIAMEGVI